MSVLDDYNNGDNNLWGLILGLLWDIVKIIFFGALAIELIFN